MDRREFIKTSAITGTSVALASCGSPENQLIRFIPEEELVPGIAVLKPSVCPVCRAGCGVVVRVMEGEAEVVRNGQPGIIRMNLAKKLEGNPAHPISQGKLCPRGQAAIQLTYHPDRITQPLKRTGVRGSGAFEPTTWEEGLSDLVSRLDQLAAANEQRALGFLMRPISGRRGELVAEFLKRFGAPAPITFELFGDDVLRRANALSFGREQLPTFDLEPSRYVLAFGADFLGTWNSPVAQNAAYGTMRQGRLGVRAKFVQVEPRMSQTGANADEWIPITPGTEGVLALGLAHVILAGGQRAASAAGRAGTLIDGWSGGLQAYAPAEVAARTGVAAARIERLARELAEHPPSVVVIGGAPLAQTNGLFQALAVNALNALLGSVGQPGGLFFTPQLDPLSASSAPQTQRGSEPTRAATGSGQAGGRDAATVQPPARTIEAVSRDILSADRSPIQLLLVDGANPVFATPHAWPVRGALEKIPYIVSFGSFIDETSALADLILPDHSFLESWVDSLPESGSKVAVANAAPPAMKPLHQTRAMPDVLLEVAPRLARPLTPPLPWQTFDQVLGVTFASLAPKPSAPDAPVVDVWSTAQEQGGWWGEPPTGVGTRAAAAPSQPTRVVAEPEFAGDVNEYAFHFLPYASQAFLDGSLAHLPWLQELPDVLTSAMWSSWVELNPQTAERLGIAQGDLVEITSPHGSIRAPAVIFPGLAPDLVAMPVGQGHQTFTRYASGRGTNPVSILAPLVEAETGALAWAATRVRVTRVGRETDPLTGLGTTQAILYGSELREHPHGHER